MAVAYLSLDPYIGSVLRGRHMGHAVPRALQDSVPGAIVGQVVETDCPGLGLGDWVHSEAGCWQELVALPANAARLIDIGLARPSAFLGVLGLPGLTAWASATQLARITSGDIALVDAAAGAVGGVWGQLARQAGAERVVGVAGGPEKCAIAVQQYGFDACVDYHRRGWEDELASALPQGLSVFHENVSAQMAMQALALAKPYARGVLCGMAANYQTDQPCGHALNAGLVIGRRASLHGLVVYDFLDRYDQFLADCGELVRKNLLTVHEDVVKGLEQAPVLFERLMQGRNIGKAIVATGTA